MDRCPIDRRPATLVPPSWPASPADWGLNRQCSVRCAQWAVVPAGDNADGTRRQIHPPELSTLADPARAKDLVVSSLLQAIYDRIVVAGENIISAMLTPEAPSHGIAIALPQPPPGGPWAHQRTEALDSLVAGTPGELPALRASVRLSLRCKLPRAEVNDGQSDGPIDWRPATRPFPLWGSVAVWLGTSQVMSAGREWIHHGGRTEPWHLRGSPNRWRRMFGATTSACGLVFGRKLALAVWSGDGPPAGKRCPVCLGAEQVLEVMDGREV